MASLTEAIEKLTEAINNLAQSNVLLAGAMLEEKEGEDDAPRQYLDGRAFENGHL